MRRRQFIALLGGAAGTWISDSYAQGSHRLPHVGLVLPGSPDSTYLDFLAGFRQGLAEFGYVEDRNIIVEVKWAEGHFDRLPTLAAELLDRRIDIIVTSGLPTTIAASRVAKTIPIVQASGGDIISNGLAASFSRPGGNVTGLLSLGEDLGAKLLEALLMLVPNVSRVAVLHDPRNPAATSQFASIQALAPARHVSVYPEPVSEPIRLDDALAKLQREKPDAFIVAADAFLLSQSRRIVNFAAHAKIPAIYPWRYFAAEGGLMSYGANIRENYRKAARYVDQILKGAHAADLAIERATTFELVINLKAAKAFGLTIPTSVLARADEVIE
jgi:putative tryptophan/tyrosine transport system substrate-binding protein